MAFNKHKESDLLILLLTTAFILVPVLATTNIDCKGKAFHCFNSTHFKICVDLGGVSKTVDDFLIPCPPSTVCTDNNYFECEYKISTTSAAVQIQSDVTNEFIEETVSTPWELFDVTTFRSINNNVENVTLLENSTTTTSEIVSDAVGFEIDNNSHVNDLNEEITASYPHNSKINDLSDSVLNNKLTSTTITSATIDNESSNISSAAVSENYSASEISIALMNTIATTPLNTVSREDVDFTSTHLFSTVITDNLKKQDSTGKVKNYSIDDISIGVYEPVTTTPMSNIRNNDLFATELLSPVETDNLSTSLATEKSSIYLDSQKKIASDLYKGVTSTQTDIVNEDSSFTKLFFPLKTNDLSPGNSFTTEATRKYTVTESEISVDLFNSVKTNWNNVETEELNKDFIPTTVSFYVNENYINAENVVKGSSSENINFSSFSDYNLESTQKYNTIDRPTLTTTKANELNPMSISNVAMKTDSLEGSSINEKNTPISRIDQTSTHTSMADSILTEKIMIPTGTESEISIDLYKYKNLSSSKKKVDLSPNNSITTAATKKYTITESEILVGLFNPVSTTSSNNIETEELNKDFIPTTKSFSAFSSDNINFSSYSDYNLASTQQTHQHTTIDPPTEVTTKTNELNAMSVTNVGMKTNTLESSSINEKTTRINSINRTSTHTSMADSVPTEKVAISSGNESEISTDLYKYVTPATENQDYISTKLSSSEIKVDLSPNNSNTTAATKEYTVTDSEKLVDLFNPNTTPSLNNLETEEFNKDFIPTPKSFSANENYIYAENIVKEISSDNIHFSSFSDYNAASTQQYTTMDPPTGATTKANELNAMSVTNVAMKNNSLESPSINEKNTHINRIDQTSTHTSMADSVLTEKVAISSGNESEISTDLYKYVTPATKNQDYISTKLSSSEIKVHLSPNNSNTTAATKEYTVAESEKLVDLFNPNTTTSLNTIENEELNKDFILTTKSFLVNENYINAENIVKGSSSDNINLSSFSDYNLLSTQQFTTMDPPTGATTKDNELNAMSITNVAMKTNSLESSSVNDKNTRINRIDLIQTSMADSVLTEKTEISADAESEISRDLYKHVIPEPKNQDYTLTKLSSSMKKVDLSPNNSITTAATKEYTVTESEILVGLINPVTTTSFNNIEIEELNNDLPATTIFFYVNENYMNTENIVKGSSSDNMNFSSFSDYNLASTQQYTTMDPQIQNNTIANELNAVSIYTNASEFYTNVAMKTSHRLEDSTTAAKVALNNTIEGFSITEQQDSVPLISDSNLISENIETDSLSDVLAITIDSYGGNVHPSTNMKNINFQRKSQDNNVLPSPVILETENIVTKSSDMYDTTIRIIADSHIANKNQDIKMTNANLSVFSINNGTILFPSTTESVMKDSSTNNVYFAVTKVRSDSPQYLSAYNSDNNNFTTSNNFGSTKITSEYKINVSDSTHIENKEQIDNYGNLTTTSTSNHLNPLNYLDNQEFSTLKATPKDDFSNEMLPAENQIQSNTENVTYGMGVSKNFTKIDISTRKLTNENNTSANPVNWNTTPLIYYDNSYAGLNDNIFNSTNTESILNFTENDSYKNNLSENVTKSSILASQSFEITQTMDSSREVNIFSPLVTDSQNNSYGEAKKATIHNTSRDLKLDKGSTYDISKDDFPIGTNILNDKISSIDQDNITPTLEINKNPISSTSSVKHIFVSTDRTSLLKTDLLYNKNIYATNTLKPIPSQLKNSYFQSNTAPPEIENKNTTKGNTILTNDTKANSQITKMQMIKTSIPGKALRVSVTPTIDFMDIAITSKNISTYNILSDIINKEKNTIKEEPTTIVSEFGDLNIQDNMSKSGLLSNQHLQNVTPNNKNISQLHKKKKIDLTDYTYNNKLISDGNTQSPLYDKNDIALNTLKTKIEKISLGVERNNATEDILKKNFVNTNLKTNMNLTSVINGQPFHESAESITIRPNYIPSLKNQTINNSTPKVMNLTNLNDIFLVKFINKQHKSMDNKGSIFNRTQINIKLLDNSSTSPYNANNTFILKIKDQFNNNSNNLDKYQNNQNVNFRVLKNADRGLEKNTNITNIDLINMNVLNNETTKSKFSCNNRRRGKYSDKNNCQNFYVCIGRHEPIFGECPNKTVFSEISKQCTKNLSHCIRNNQFQCVSPGRYIDIFSDQFYYICAKRKEGHIRFKMKCQKGYHLNKTNLRCVLDLFNGSKSNEDSSKIDSDKSTTETKSKEDSKRKNEEKKELKDFECKKEGKFVFQNDCRKYYQCSRSGRTVYRRKIKKCDSDEVFNNEKNECVDEESYECK